jgi:pimeloyl-ACP methyl ester carboxylesterase
VQPALQLAQVCVGDLGARRELAQRQFGGQPLRPQQSAKDLAGSLRCTVAHRTHLRAPWCRPSSRRDSGLAVIAARMTTLDAQMPAAPAFIRTLVGQYDPAVFDTRRRPTRVRLAVDDAGAWDVVMTDDGATIAPPEARADALLAADAGTWRQIAADLRGGIDAYRSGRLSVRRNLHAGVGFLAATSGANEPGRLRFRTVRTARAHLSIMEAGTGPPALALHGLGGTKGSFLPTVAGLANRFRVIAVDLPGFGDSDKPIGAAYDAPFFARAAVDLLDALALDRVHVIGNSLGGRVVLEIALRHPDRVGRLGLLAPSLAWRRERRWLPMLRLARPELGLLQLAPRQAVEAIVHRMIPGADEGWTAAGVDEFLRAYLTPAGRAAFYAAARQIYLEEPDGEKGSGHACGRSRLMRCSSGAAVTASYRSRSPATSPTPYHGPAISSSTADTCRRLSAPNKPTRPSPSFYRRLPTTLPARDLTLVTERGHRGRWCKTHALSAVTGFTLVCVAAGCSTSSDSATTTQAPATTQAAVATRSATSTTSAVPRRARARARKAPPKKSASPLAPALAVSTASSTSIQPQPTPGSCHARGSSLFSLPDPRCTPGAISPAVNQADLQSTICRDGYTKTVRPPESITEPEKEASLAAYGDAEPLHDYEYDHLVPLELGGAANDPRNLWPEPGATPNPKDELENRLRSLVCDGQLSLSGAQREIATDWIAVYHRLVG